MFIVWAAAIIIFGVFEAITAQLVSIWFVAGAIGGLIAAMLNAPIYLQVVVFIVITILALAITRPLVKKYIKPKMQRTNADRVISQIGIVAEEIDNINGKGEVRIDGKVWSARSADNNVIPLESKVQVLEISGVKLIVKKV
ncbi:MAG: NfeD family protein [Acetobacter sp.]|nr:NfeD family protein [Bacteroides sp.]MCM1341118.1 NfeD family protein [Acetobacter sp.]MCM1433548.1 NfeD family protein [Clostridiales bacterium]